MSDNWKVLGLIERLVGAAEAGECPDPDCPICKEKHDAIQEAKDYLEDEKSLT